MSNPLGEVTRSESLKETGLDDGPALPHPRVLERAYRNIEENAPKYRITEDDKQKFFEEGYDQCFREVIDEINGWKHPDKASFVMWLKDVFKSSAATLK